MIDNFALALSHGLILLAVWRLMFRPDLDDDGADPESTPKPWRKNAGKPRSKPGA